MWIKLIVAFMAIKLSEEGCDKLPNFSRLRFQSYTYERKIDCSDITLDFDLNGYIKTNGVDMDVEIGRSNLPELTEKMLQNITVKNFKIQADVKTIKSKAFAYSKISSLTLDDNRINEIEDWSFNSSSIERLNFQNNNLSRIRSNSFRNIRELRELSLRNNNITEIEANSFNSLTSLETIDLSYNKLSKLDSNLFQIMEDLETIFLNDNLLTELSDHMFYNCKSLKFLYIQNNLIARIEGRYYPKSLVSINASNNTLKYAHFSVLVNLETIDLSLNKLTSIDDWSYGLSSLKQLRLSHNSIGPFINTKALDHMKNLTVIEMDDNELRNLDIELFSGISKLQQLSLARNGLHNFTVSDFGIHLTSLNLSRNFLSEVKNLTIMQDLVKLDLSHNSLQEIKYNSFDRLNKLEELHLEYNSIHTIHLGCFKDLKSLKSLDLSHNQINKVDTGTFSGADALTTLDISYNNITHMDENVFHNLKSLYYLNIANNNFSKIEIKTLLSHIPFLREVTLTGNKWTCDALAELLKGRMSLAHGSEYNVTNVYGIPCKKTDNSQLLQSNSSVNTSVYYDYIQEISYKMSVNNVVLIILLILLCVKFSYGRCSSGYNTVRRYFDQKYKHEQEMQLI